MYVSISFEDHDSKDFNSTSYSLTTVLFICSLPFSVRIIFFDLPLYFFQ
ncbi:MAG: hypothetical protein PWP28_2321 [Oceanotoga sp.]|jgi:hypothetical protein|nr:hypothetical protein [Oceanotoga sp.]